MINKIISRSLFFTCAFTLGCTSGYLTTRYLWSSSPQFQKACVQPHVESFSNDHWLVLNMLHQSNQRGLFYSQKSHDLRVLSIAFVLYLNSGDVSDRASISGDAIKNHLKMHFSDSECRSALIGMVGDVGDTTFPELGPCNIRTTNGEKLFIIFDRSFLDSADGAIVSNKLRIDRCQNMFIDYIYSDGHLDSHDMGAGK